MKNELQTLTPNSIILQTAFTFEYIGCVRLASLGRPRSAPGTFE